MHVKWYKLTEICDTAMQYQGHSDVQNAKCARGKKSLSDWIQEAIV